MGKSGKPTKAFKIKQTSSLIGEGYLETAIQIRPNGSMEPLNSKMIAMMPVFIILEENALV